MGYQQFIQVGKFKCWKEFLNYLAKKPYIEVAGLVARIAAWQKAEEPKQNKDDKIKKNLS